MNFRLNPCKSVTQEVSSSGDDINNINDLCYGICTSYGRVYGSNVEQECRDSCADMVSRKKHDLGRNNCNQRRPLPSLSWLQVPDYYPELLKETQNHEKAYQICCNRCSQSFYPNDCKDKCRINAQAVETQSVEKFDRLPRRYWNSMPNNTPTQLVSSPDNRLPRRYWNSMPNNILRE